MFNVLSSWGNLELAQAPVVQDNIQLRRVGGIEDRAVPFVEA